MDAAAGIVRFGDGVVLPYDPFPGTIGVAPMRRIVSSVAIYIPALLVVTVIGVAITHLVGLDHGTTAIDTVASGSFTGSGFRASESNAVKSVVFTPMPSASVRTATAVNPGLLPSIRIP